jgi:hypothetical protein
MNLICRFVFWLCKKCGGRFQRQGDAAATLDVKP